MLCVEGARRFGWSYTVVSCLIRRFKTFFAGYVFTVVEVKKHFLAMRLFGEKRTFRRDEVESAEGFALIQVLLVVCAKNSWQIEQVLGCVA